MKQMVLVPSSSLIPTNPQNSIASKEVTALDQEITRILNSNISSYDKLYSYLDTLHRYLAMKENIPIPKFEISNIPQTSVSTTPLSQKPTKQIPFSPQFAPFYPKYSDNGLEESVRKTFGEKHADSFMQGFLESARKLRDSELGAAGYTPDSQNMSGNQLDEMENMSGNQVDDMELFQYVQPKSQKRKKRRNRRKEADTLDSPLPKGTRRRMTWKDAE